MNIVLRYCGLNARTSWRALVEEQLNKLENLAKIASARVIVERRHQFTPAFQVSALLEVPGPDFHAEASDHTFAAAVRKVVRNLERQIRSRNGHHIAKRKSHVQLGLSPLGRWSPGATAPRA